MRRKQEEPSKLFSGFRTVIKITVPIVAVIMLFSFLCNKQQKTKSEKVKIYTQAKIKKKERINAQYVTVKYTGKYTRIVLKSGVWNRMYAPPSSYRWTMSRDKRLDKKYLGNSGKLVHIAVNGDRKNSKPSGLVNGEMVTARFKLTEWVFFRERVEYVEFYPEKGVGNVIANMTFAY